MRGIQSAAVVRPGSTGSAAGSSSSSSGGGHTRQWAHVTCARLMSPQLAFTPVDRDSAAQLITGVHAPIAPLPLLLGVTESIPRFAESGSWFERASQSAGRCCVCSCRGGVTLACAVAGCKGRVHGICAAELGLIADAPPLDAEAAAEAAHAAAAVTPELHLSAARIAGGAPDAEGSAVYLGTVASDRRSAADAAKVAALAPLPGLPPSFRYLASPGPPMHPVRLCAAMRAGAPVNPHLGVPAGMPQPADLAPLTAAARRALLPLGSVGPFIASVSGRGRPAIPAAPSSLFVYCSSHRVPVPCRLEQVRVSSVCVCVASLVTLTAPALPFPHLTGRTVAVRQAAGRSTGSQRC